MLGDSSDGLVSGGMCRAEEGAVCPSSSDDDSVCGRRTFFFQEQCTAGACVLSESPISVSFPSGMNKLQFGNFF